MVGVLLAAGCYGLTVVPTTSPTPGMTVRVFLAPGSTDNLTGLLGPDADALDGRVLSSTPDTVFLGIHRVLRQDGRVEAWGGERVALALRSVTSVEGRHLSVVRTALLVGGVVTAMVLIARSLVVAPAAPSVIY